MKPEKINEVMEAEITARRTKAAAEAAKLALLAAREQTQGMVPGVEGLTPAQRFTRLWDNIEALSTKAITEEGMRPRSSTETREVKIMMNGVEHTYDLTFQLSGSGATWTRMIEAVWADESPELAIEDHYDFMESLVVQDLWWQPDIQTDTEKAKLEDLEWTLQAFLDAAVSVIV